MIITGKYKRDDNFTTVCADNTIYTIARHTRDWGCVKVGEISGMSRKLTQEDYDRYLSECDREGTFELIEE